MKANVRAILEDCIERGIHHAVLNFEHVVPSPYQLEEKIEHEVWLQIDQLFTFEDDV